MRAQLEEKRKKKKENPRHPYGCYSAAQSQFRRASSGPLPLAFLEKPPSSPARRLGANLGPIGEPLKAEFHYTWANVYNLDYLFNRKSGYFGASRENKAGLAEKRGPSDQKVVWGILYYFIPPIPPC